jgi:signal transduction histidine kinase/ligand-binding sensor domain-containing protein
MRNIFFFGFIFFCLLPFISESQSDYRFESVNKAQGLSQGTINAIFEDHDGFMWFGTNDGLNRYDGKQMVVYRKNHYDQNSLPNNHILSINQDWKSRLWVGTNGNGLSFFDQIHGTFHPFDEMIENPAKINIGENIYCISIDTINNILWTGSNIGIAKLNLIDGSLEFIDLRAFRVGSAYVGNIYCLLAEADQLWIGSDFGGLLRLNLEDNSISSIPIQKRWYRPGEPDHQGTILKIIKDKTGQLWAASFGDYLLKLDHDGKSMQKIDLPSPQSENQAFCFLRSLIIVNDSIMWCASSSGGIQIINLNNNKIENINYSPFNPKGINSSGLKTLFCDKSNGIWIGNNGHGINYYYPVNKKIQHLAPASSGSTGLTFRSVRRIYRDQEKILWVGGYGGLDAFDSNYKRIIDIPEIGNAYFIHPDQLDTEILWVGVEGGGLHKIRKKDGVDLRAYYSKNPMHEEGIVGTGIFCIQDKSPEELWVGTETALNLFHKKTGRSKHFIHDDSNSFSVPKGRIRVVYNDSKNRTWIGTLGGGLAYMTDNNLIFNNFRFDKDDSQSISSNIIYCVFESKNSQIYIGTDNGLNLFDEKTNGFKKINTTDGLINDVVYGILEDENGDIWMSTNEGISCYNTTTGAFRNYDQRDGMQANEFNSGAYYKDDGGTLYFGGVNGLSIFSPQDLQDNKKIPKIIFTQLKIGDKQAVIDPPITRAKEIRLDYYDQSFTLEFAALNYYKPQKNQYAYRIVELHDKWINLGNENKVNIVRLGYGVFTIKVIASNNDDVWNNEGISLKIIIDPPYWATLWFKVLVVFALISLVSAIFYFRMKNLRDKKKQLQAEVEASTRELKLTNLELMAEIETRVKTEKELLLANQTKDKFFSIIAHDLKNPFNVLLGFTELLRDGLEDFEPSELQESIQAMHKSTVGMYNLLENLLTWATAQRGQLVIDPQKVDLNNLINSNIQLLSGQANQKYIRLKSAIAEGTTVWADKNTINTVLRNLISNAIKFTPQHGMIAISAIESASTVSVSVEDTGVGISEENISKLFQIDEQFRMPGTANEKGTGLGLILCQEFIKLNKGKLTVSSIPGKGSTFTFTLPCSSEVL